MGDYVTVGSSNTPEPIRNNTDLLDYWIICI